MPSPTEAKRLYAQTLGYDPDTVDVSDDGTITPKADPQPAMASSAPPAATAGKEYTAGQSAMIAAGEQALPTAAAIGVPSAIAGAGLLSGVGTLPTLGILGAAGLISGFGTSALQRKVMPEEWKQAIDTSAQQHPTAALLGGLAPQAATMRPSLEDLGLIRSAVGKVLSPQNLASGEIAQLVRGAANPFARMTEGEVGALGGAVLGGGVQGGLEAYNQYQQGEFDPARLGLMTGAGTLLTRPWGVGKLLTPKMVQERPLPPSERGLPVVGDVERPIIKTYQDAQAVKAQEEAAKVAAKQEKEAAKILKQENAVKQKVLKEKIKVDAEELHGGLLKTTDVTEQGITENLPIDTSKTVTMAEPESLTAHLEEVSKTQKSARQLEEEASKKAFLEEQAKAYDKLQAEDKAVQEQAKIEEAAKIAAKKEADQRALEESAKTKPMSRQEEEQAKALLRDRKQYGPYAEYGVTPAPDTPKETADKFQQEKSSIHDSWVKSGKSVNDPQYLATINELARRYGIRIVLDPNLSVKEGKPVLGAFKEESRTAVVEPAKASADTPVHEMMEGIYADLPPETRTGIETKIVSDADYKLWKNTRESRGMDSSPREYLMSRAGFKWVRRYAGGGGLGEKAKDFVRGVRLARGTISADEAAELLAKRLSQKYEKYEVPKGKEAREGETYGKLTKEEEELREKALKYQKYLEIKKRKEEDKNAYQKQEAVEEVRSVPTRSATQVPEGESGEVQRTAGEGKGKEVDDFPQRAFEQEKKDHPTLDDEALKTIVEDEIKADETKYREDIDKENPPKKFSEEPLNEDKWKTDARYRWTPKEDVLPQGWKTIEGYLYNNPAKSGVIGLITDEGKVHHVYVKDGTTELISPPDKKGKEVHDKAIQEGYRIISSGEMDRAVADLFDALNNFKSRWNWKGNDPKDTYEKYKRTPRATTKNSDAAVKNAILEARKNGPTPEFRALFGGIEPELVGTTFDKVYNFAKTLDIEYRGTFDPANPDIRYSEEGLGSQERFTPSKSSSDHYFRPLKFMAASLDKLRGTGIKGAPETADAIQGAIDYTGVLQGQLGNKMNEYLKHFSREDRKAVLEYRQAKDLNYRLTEADLPTTKALPTLSPKQEELNTILNDEWWFKTRDYANEAGIRGGEAAYNENYFAAMPSLDAIHTMLNKKHTPEGQYMRRLWAEHLAKFDDRNVPGERKAKDARADVDNYLEGVASNDYQKMQFNPLYKRAGHGIPIELQEKDLANLVNRYTRRASKSIAYAKFIENNPNRDVPALLHVKDEHGHLILSDNVKKETDIPEVREAVKMLKEDYHVDNKKVAGLIKVVHASLMGAPAGLRDIASLPMQASPYIRSLSDLAASFRGLAKAASMGREASHAGAYRTDQLDVEFGTMFDPDAVADGFSKVAYAIRNLQGRQGLENMGRTATYAVGKEIAKTNWGKAVRGDKKARAWLEDMAATVNIKEMLDNPTLMDDSKLQQIAKSFTDRVQGYFDARGLPKGVMEGSFAPFFALQKWGISKTNQIYKDVIVPAKNGNFLPLLSYTGMGVLSGLAIRELTDFLKNKRSEDATYKEASAAGSEVDQVAAIVNTMALSGYYGIVSDVLKSAGDIVTKRDLPRGFSFPTADFLSDTVGSNIAAYAAALADGAPVAQTTAEFMQALMAGSLQNYRMIANHAWEKDSVERSEKFRDSRVFKRLQGETVPPSYLMNTTKFSKPASKEFKQLGDVSELPEKFGAAIDEAVTRSKGDPYKLKENLQALRQNSYQTIPDPEREPSKFIEFTKFLAETQGEEATNRRIADYFQQKALNRMKTRLVPALGGR
jgi:hypothetical protein